MNGFEIVFVICAVVVAGTSWLLPKLLSWHFKRRFHVDVRIGGIRLPYIRLKDVHIICHGFTVHIEEVGFQSSFFNSEVTKLVSVIIKDVRINKDVGGSDCQKMENSSPRAKETDSVGEIPSFHNKKIPPMIITFAQFMAVRVYNVSVMLLRVASPEWLLHASADSIHVDGSIVHNSHLLVNVCISSATAKVLKHAHGNTMSTRKQEHRHYKVQSDGVKDETQTCLGQLSFGVTLEAALVARGALSVEDSTNNSTIGSEFLEWLSEASVVIQMSRLTAQYFPSPRESVEALSFDLDYMKLKYEKSQGSSLDQLALEEVIMKNLWCHLGKMPFDQIYTISNILGLRREKYHYWGSPLFVELLRVKYPKPGNATPLPVDIVLSSVQMEWTPHLHPVALEALRHLLELQKALSSKSNQPLQRVQNDRRERCSSSSCQSSSIKLTMLDCNVYLMDGLSAKVFKNEDPCYMLRFDTTEYHSSSELLSFNVEGFKAITILENRVGLHACARSVDLKEYWLYVKSLKGASHYPFGEITVELENKIELFWSQELHSWVSSMKTSVQDFLKSLSETYYLSHPRNRRNADPWSMTIKANCPARVVVDVFQTTTEVLFTLMKVFKYIGKTCIENTSRPILQDILNQHE